MKQEKFSRRIPLRLRQAWGVVILVALAVFCFFVGLGVATWRLLHRIVCWPLLSPEEKAKLLEDEAKAHWRRS